MGRKRIYKDDAEKAAAFRSKISRFDLTVDNDLAKTIESICDTHSVTKNSAITSMLKFALTNHNWKHSMVWIKK